MRRTSSCRRSKYPPTLRPVFACPRPIRRKSPRAASPYRAARIWPSKAERTDVSSCMSARASTGSPSRNSRTGRAGPFRRRVCVTCPPTLRKKSPHDRETKPISGNPSQDSPILSFFTLPLDERHVVQTGFRCEIPFVPELGTGDLLGVYSGNYGSTYWTACCSR